jgi:hypothetical protein
MSEVKQVKVRKPREKKTLQPVPENEQLAPKEPKQRKPRATKKEPTKEEAMKMLEDACKELEVIIHDLKEDIKTLNGIKLLKVPELVDDTINNLEEDMEEFKNELDHLKNMPDQE